MVIKIKNYLITSCEIVIFSGLKSYFKILSKFLVKSRPKKANKNPDLRRRHPTPLIFLAPPSPLASWPRPLSWRHFLEPFFTFFLKIAKKIIKDEKCESSEKQGKVLTQLKVKNTCFVLCFLSSAKKGKFSKLFSDYQSGDSWCTKFVG